MSEDHENNPPRDPTSVESPWVFHVIGPGKFFEAKKGMIVEALAESRVVIRRGATGIFRANSSGVVHAGGNFTADPDSSVTALYASSGRAMNRARIIKHYGAEIAAEEGAIINEVADDENHLPVGHVFTTYGALDDDEKSLVDVAKDSSRKAYCPKSGFPVGAAVLAENAQGQRSVFWGCNIENGVDYTDAESNAMDSAVKAGCRRILKLAVFCPRNPGVTPGPHARASLRHFGLDAVVFNVFNEKDVVVRFTVRQLLHLPKQAPQA